ncbi:10504_t:CDS:2, partial [Entrophospora sp. SA101]
AIPVNIREALTSSSKNLDANSKFRTHLNTLNLPSHRDLLGFDDINIDGNKGKLKLPSLPHSIHTVFLSAIISNSMEFAEWICKTHHQPCHVVYTDFRPTPLQHYIYIDHLNEICLLVDEKGTFYENAFQKKIREPFNTEPKNSDNTKLRRNNVHSMIKACISSNLDPIIAFAFSNKECNNLAIQLNKMDFNNGKTKVVDNAMDLLAEEDRQLKSIHDLLSLLKCGIGIYHSELLPFLKEVPAKTVVFCDLTKFYGSTNRN